jgi:hypothetical protein
MKKETINPGDVVQYIDAQFNKDKKKVVKISKQGIWDGEKVILNDKEETTVRNLDYLKLFKGIYLPYIKIEKQIIEVVIFSKESIHPILWGDFNHIKLEDNDYIQNGYVEPWRNGDDNSGGDHYSLTIKRKRLETEEESTKRIHKEEINKKMLRSRRFESYLKLKKEFENE